MKYCKECGNTVVDEGNEKYVCKSCGGVYHNNPKASAGVMLIGDDNKLILGRRSIEPRKGKLGLIGGFSDAGESLEETALRELYEEAGLRGSDITELTYFGSAYNDYSWQNRIIPVVDAFFTARLHSGVHPTPSDELDSYVHVDPATLSKDEISFSTHWKMIKKYIKSL